MFKCLPVSGMLRNVKGYIIQDIESFMLYVKPLTHVASVFLAIFSRATCNATFEMLAMACYRNLSMLSILLAIV